MIQLMKWLTNFSFLTPDYFIFWILAAAVLLFLAMVLLLKIFFRPRRSKHSRYYLFGRDFVWLPCFMLSVLITIALAGPEGKYGYVVSAGGQIDVIFALDYSFSMAAKDLKPSRLERTKKEILNFLNSPIWQKGDRFTLFTFGKNSNWLMPFSEDSDELRVKLMELSHPEVYFEESQLTTDLAAVLEHIPTALDKVDNFYQANRRHLGVRDASRRRIVFLFSDGDDQIKNNLDKGLRGLSQRKVIVYSVGVGTKIGQTVKVKLSLPFVPIFDSETGIQIGGYNGVNEEVMIRTALQTQNLNKIAEFTGGQMFILDSDHGYSRNFLENAVQANRATSFGLSYTTESKNIWWEVLAIPALIFLFLVIVLV